jgi:hypothetical protein
VRALSVLIEQHHRVIGRDHPMHGHERQELMGAIIERFRPSHRSLPRAARAPLRAGLKEQRHRLVREHGGYLKMTTEHGYLLAQRCEPEHRVPLDRRSERLADPVHAFRSLLPKLVQPLLGQASAVHMPPPGAHRAASRNESPPSSVASLRQPIPHLRFVAVARSSHSRETGRQARELYFRCIFW